jgi:hypothetical protein
MDKINSGAVESNRAPEAPNKQADKGGSATVLARSLAALVLVFLNPFLLTQVLRQSFGQVLCSLRELRRKTVPHPVTISLPFDQECYVGRGGPTRKTSHSWHVLPQRYALDILRVDEHLSSSAPPHKKLQDYYIFGAPVLSPIDGTVIAASGRQHDHLPGLIMSLSIISRDLRGNYCTIEDASGRCCVLAHLSRGSLAVRIGDTVKRGQKIGICGNSGHSTEPHLHIQMQTSRSFYSSLGLPIVFDNAALRRDREDQFHSPATGPQRGDFLKTIPDVNGTGIEHAETAHEAGQGVGPADLGYAIFACATNVATALAIYYELTRLILDFARAL